jgi:hypothetical protein
MEEFNDTSKEKKLNGKDGKRFRKLVKDFSMGSTFVYYEDEMRKFSAV